MVASIPFNLLPPTFFFFLHYFHLFIKYVHFCPAITLREPCIKKHINKKLFTKNATFWRVLYNVDSLITVSRMTAPIISDNFLRLYSIYSDLIVIITFSLYGSCGADPALQSYRLNFKQIASRNLYPVVSARMGEVAPPLLLHTKIHSSQVKERNISLIHKSTR